MLKPCPTCHREGKILADDTGFYVQCTLCTLKGPPEDTKELAIDSWNDRPWMSNIGIRVPPPNTDKLDQVLKSLDDTNSKLDRIISLMETLGASGLMG